MTSGILRTALLTLFALSAAACASLSVQVDILDQRYWLSPEWLGQERAARIQRTYYKVAGGTLERDREELRLALTEKVSQVIDRLCLGLEAVVATETKPEVTEAMVAKVDALVGACYAGVGTGIRAAYEALLRAENGTSARESALDEAWKLFQPAEAALTELPHAIQALERELGRDLRVFAPARAPVPEEAADEDSRRAAAEVLALASDDAARRARGLIGDRGLLDDPFASAVINAPERFWQGQFNETYGRGSLGNIDIAVKMENVGQFTVKGVRNDAAAITRATFAVGQQAVQTIAALYGIPLPAAAQPAAGDQGSLAAPSLASPRLRLAEARAREEDLRRARAALFEALVAQRDRLGGAQRAQAITALKEAVNHFQGATESPSEPQ